MGLAVFAFPFLFMITISFEEFSFVLPSPPRVLPAEPTLQNYTNLFERQSIPLHMINSFTIAAVTVVLGLAVSSLSAYGFARIRFRGREVLFAVYLFTLMIPGVLNIIPQYAVIGGLGLIGTRAGLIVLYVGTAICGHTFFLRGFFQSIPRELTESVMMDGGTHFTVFGRIILPLAAPGLATLAILTFQFTWDDFFTAKVILGSNPSVQTMPIFVQRLHGQYATEWGLVFAAALLMLIPVIVLYVTFQRYFVVGGLSEGSVKS
jgi:multiple sugar transport system permease protein